jgi:hypothetical protein
VKGKKNNPKNPHSEKLVIYETSKNSSFKRMLIFIISSFLKDVTRECYRAKDSRRRIRQQKNQNYIKKYL